MPATLDTPAPQSSRSSRPRTPTRATLNAPDDQTSARSKEKRKKQPSRSQVNAEVLAERSGVFSGEPAPTRKSKRRETHTAKNSSQLAAALAKASHAEATPRGSPKASPATAFRMARYYPGLVRLKDITVRQKVQLERQFSSVAHARSLADPSTARETFCHEDGEGHTQYQCQLTGSVQTFTRVHLHRKVDDGDVEDDSSGSEYSGVDSDSAARTSDAGMSMAGMSFAGMSFAGMSLAGTSYLGTGSRSFNRTPGRWRAQQTRSTNGFLYRCMSKNHAVFLRDQIYLNKCQELQVHANSGVKTLLTKCSSYMCFCNLEVVSFRDNLMGDRGILPVLTLLTFARMLRCLSLAGNGMREASVRALVTMLLEPSVLLNLSCLDISCNPVPDVCSDWFTRFLPKRPTLLLVGLQSTNIQDMKKQQLHRQMVERFRSVEVQDQYEAWKLCKDELRFADRELWVKVTPVVEENYDRDMLDRVDPFIKADSTNVINGTTENNLSLFLGRLSREGFHKSDTQTLCPPSSESPDLRVIHTRSELNDKHLPATSLHQVSIGQHRGSTSWNVHDLVQHSGDHKRPATTDLMAQSITEEEPPAMPQKAPVRGTKPALSKAAFAEELNDPEDEGLSTALTDMPPDGPVSERPKSTDSAGSSSPKSPRSPRHLRGSKEVRRKSRAPQGAGQQPLPAQPSVPVPAPSPLPPIPVPPAEQSPVLLPAPLSRVVVSPEQAGKSEEV